MVFNVAYERLINNGNCVGGSFHFADGCLLALKLLIHRKKVRHFVKDMGWNLGNVRIGIIVWVVKGNSDNFFIGVTVINHRYYANGIAVYHG